VPSRVYLDDDVPDEVGIVLAGRGVQAHLPGESGTAGAPDPVHLKTCADHGWTLITFNRRDFRRLHWLWEALRAWGVIAQSHAGILTAHEQRPAPEWAAAIADILQQERLEGKMFQWRPSTRAWDPEPVRFM